MLVTRLASHLLLFMNQLPKNFDSPEKHTLFRLSPDGRMKTRHVWEPSEATRERHDVMLQKLYGLNIPMPYAYGGLPGKSLRNNVEPHLKSDVFYMLDIKDAYGSVDIDNLRDKVDIALLRNGGGKKLRAELDAFIETDAVIDGVPGLPLGYPCSPYLFNLYCREMDGRLGYALSNLPWDHRSPVQYTRWLDDLTFSGPEGSFSHERRGVLRGIIAETPGFNVESRKTKRHKLGKGAVTITGLSIYPDGRITPAPALLDKTAKLFNDALGRIGNGEVLSEQELSEINGFNSILHMAGEPERSGSRLVRQLSVKYQDIARRSLGMK